MNFFRFAIAAAGCAAAFSVTAAEQSHDQLFKALVECKASAEQVQAFSALADAGQVSFAKDEQNSPWGGLAWQLKPAMSANGVTSSTAIMGDRDSFYLIAKSDSPVADAARLGKALDLSKTLDTQGYVDYQRELQDRSVLRVVSTEDKDHDLWVGCTYGRRS